MRTVRGEPRGADTPSGEIECSPGLPPPPASGVGGRSGRRRPRGRGQGSAGGASRAAHLLPPEPGPAPSSETTRPSQRNATFQLQPRSGGSARASLRPQARLPGSAHPPRPCAGGRRGAGSRELGAGSGERAAGLRPPRPWAWPRPAPPRTRPGRVQPEVGARGRTCSKVPRGPLLRW